MKKKWIIIGIIVLFVPLAMVGSKQYVEHQEMVEARDLFFEWFYNVDPEEIAEWSFKDTRKGWTPNEVMQIELSDGQKEEFCQMMKEVSTDEVILGPGSLGRGLGDLRILTTKEEEWFFRFDGEVVYVRGVPYELEKIYGWWSWEIRNEALNVFFNQILENSTDNSLSQDKLDWFETAFFNGEENRITNMFLTSEYASAADIDLGRLFYGGADGMGGNGEVPEEEAAFVIDKFGLEKLDVAKATVVDMNAVLQKYAGLTIETTNKVGLDSLYYLEEKTAYYNVAGDTAYMKCDIEKGWTNEDGTITLQYKDALSSISDTYEVTLKAVDNSYQFVSNKKVEE